MNAPKLIADRIESLAHAVDELAAVELWQGAESAIYKTLFAEIRAELDSLANDTRALQIGPQTGISERLFECWN